MTFEQGEYWIERGRKYFQEFADQSEALRLIFSKQEEQLWKILEQLDLRGVETVMEIGCGFGRISAIVLKYLVDVKLFLCVDISKSQIKRAKERLDREVDKPPYFAVGDFRKTFVRDSFDLVIASEVFLHFPPQEIKYVLRNAQEISRRMLIHIDPFLVPSMTRRDRLGDFWRSLEKRVKGKPAITNWFHDFPKLYDHSLVGKITLFPIIDGIQHVFVVEKARQIPEDWGKS